MTKGQFFTLDAAIGLTILFVGVYIAYSSFVQEPVAQPSIQYAEDVLAILTKTRFKDMDPSHVAPGLKMLIEMGRIDRDKTILAQIGEFYYLHSLTTDLTIAEGFHNNIRIILDATTNAAIPRVYGWELKFNGVQIYSPDQGPLRPNAKISIVTQQLSFGLAGQVPYGPYPVEVAVWG